MMLLTSKKLFVSLLLLISFLFLNSEIARAETDDLKPKFITITSKWCTTCKSLKSVIEELEYLYNDKVDFITLDTSSKETLENSKEKAEELDITEFFNKNKSSLPTVGIFCNTKEGKVFTAETRREVYESTLDNLLGKDLCSL